MMLEKVKKTIRENNLLSVGDSVLVALSGGPDSVVLVHLLSQLRNRMKLNLSAVYINHQIRPRAAKKEERFCQQLCEKLGLDLTIESKDIPTLAQTKKKSLEETARDFRYTALENLANRRGHNKIALGHHLDDRVETILFRILRGTGRTGLQGIPIKRGKVVRPLYHITKQEIYSYLKKHRLKFCLDQSNTNSDFARNYIRNRLLVDIRKNLNPAVNAAILNLSETAGQEELFFKQVVDRMKKKIVRTTVGGKIELDLKPFMSYQIWLRRRLLRYCLAEASERLPAPDKEVVDRLDTLCMKGGKAVSLPDSLRAVRTAGKLVITHQESRPYAEQLKPGEACQLPGLRLTIRYRLVTNVDGTRYKEKRSKQVWLDKEKLSPPFVVRNIRPGDKFTPLGMNGTKKIGNYLTDRKVERVLRDEVPVVCDQQGVVWLVGFEIADRVKINSTTRRLIKFEVSERRKSPAHAV